MSTMEAFRRCAVTLASAYVDFKRRDARVRGPHGRWVVALYVGGVVVRAGRFGSKRRALGWIRECQRKTPGSSIRVTRFRANNWRMRERPQWSYTSTTWLGAFALDFDAARLGVSP